MANLLKAHLRHAILYLKQMDIANDCYLAGNSEIASALLNFDQNQANIIAAQKWLAEYVPKITDEDIQSDEIAHAIVDLCNAYPNTGAYLVSLRLGPNERIQWLQAALGASQRLGNVVTTQAHLGNLGLAYDELGDFTIAIKYFEQAFKLAEQIGDRYHQGAWLGNLGNIYATLGEHAKSIEFHEHQLAIAREIKDERGEGHALANLGVSFAYLGQSEKALENYQHFLKLAVRRGDRRDESQALLNIGLAYYDMGQLDAATDALHTARVICTELNDSLTQALVMGSLSDIDIERKDYQGAIRNLYQALKMLDKVHHDVRAELRLLHSLGNAYNASADYPRALEVYSQQYTLAESIGAKASMCNVLANQTSIHRAVGNLEQALKLGKRGLQLSQTIGSLSNEVFIRWQLGLIYEAQGVKEKALNELETAIQLESQIGGYDLEAHRQYLACSWLTSTEEL